MKIRGDSMVVESPLKLEEQHGVYIKIKEGF